jgi:hypothetical protein
MHQSIVPRVKDFPMDKESETIPQMSGISERGTKIKLTTIPPTLAF